MSRFLIKAWSWLGNLRESHFNVALRSSLWVHWKTCEGLHLECRRRGSLIWQRQREAKHLSNLSYPIIFVIMVETSYSSFWWSSLSINLICFILVETESGFRRDQTARAMFKLHRVSWETDERNLWVWIRCRSSQTFSSSSRRGSLVLGLWAKADSILVPQSLVPSSPVLCRNIISQQQTIVCTSIITIISSSAVTTQVVNTDSIPRVNDQRSTILRNQANIGCQLSKSLNQQKIRENRPIEFYRHPRHLRSRHQKFASSWTVK